MAIYQKLDEEQEINQTNRVIEGNRMENRIYQMPRLINVAYESDWCKGSIRMLSGANAGVVDGAIVGAIGPYRRTSAKSYASRPKYTVE